jgi:hypothetical protein
MDILLLSSFLRMVAKDLSLKLREHLTVFSSLIPARLFLSIVSFGGRNSSMPRNEVHSSVGYGTVHSTLS